MAWVIDLDGVVWLAEQPIPGSGEAVERLRRRGERVVFVTNNSSMTVGSYADKLGAMGIDAPADDIVTSAQAAASLLPEGSSAVVCGGPGVVEACQSRRVEVRREGPADAVVVGFNREFDFERLTAAARAVWGGARLIGTNHDATYPTPDGPLPGAGSLIAAVAYATGQRATVAGKPNEPLVELLRDRVGKVDVVVGDRPDTDGQLAARLGCRFALVLSGVTPPNKAPAEGPWRIADDLASVVAFT